MRWATRVVALLVLAGVWMRGCDTWFYHPSATITFTPRDLGLKFDELRFASSDGVPLHGWLLHSEQQPARGAVVHFHANAGNISDHLPLVSWLPRHGYHVLTFDYRGYGQSGGSLSRAGTILDGLAAVDLARQHELTAMLPIAALGHSLGGAIAISVAAQRPVVRGVVAESTFASYRSIAARHAPGADASPAWGRWLASRLVSAGHDPIDALPSFAPRPLLLLSAGSDTICYAEFSDELEAAARAAGSPVEHIRVPGAYHLGIIEVLGEREYEQRIVRWLDALMTSTDDEANAGGVGSGSSDR